MYIPFYYKSAILTTAQSSHPNPVLDTRHAVSLRLHELLLGIGKTFIGHELAYHEDFSSTCTYMRSRPKMMVRMIFPSLGHL